MSTHTSIKFDPITVNEAAELGEINRRTVLKQAKLKKFRARRPSRHYQIDRLTFLDWLASTEKLV